MTASQAIGTTIALACSMLLFHGAQRDRKRTAPFSIYVWGYAAALLWAVAAYRVATT